MNRWMIVSLSVFALAIAVGVALFAPRPVEARSVLAGARMTVVKSPTCGCCGSYVDVLRRHGLEVTVIEDEDVAGTKERFGVPGHLGSCHTAELAGYAVEGHVPMDALRTLLRDRPEVTGIALPGMPAGSPGMNGIKSAPFEVYAFDAAGVRGFGAF